MLAGFKQVSEEEVSSILQKPAKIRDFLRDGEGDNRLSRPPFCSFA